MNVADRDKVAYAREQRRQPTETEFLLWRSLRKRQLGAKFRRQHPLGDFVLDFYCAEAELVVEVDGRIHRRQADYDRWREETLTRLGLRVLRFTEEEVWTRLPEVLRAVQRCLTPPWSAHQASGQGTASPRPAGTPLRSGEGDGGELPHPGRGRSQTSAATFPSPRRRGAEEGND